MKRNVIILGILAGIHCISGAVFAQPFGNTESSQIREGNGRYESGDFAGAEKSYQGALEKNANSAKGIFNLGDAYYRQERYEEAAQQFDLASKVASDKLSRAEAFHNMGNAFMGQKDYGKSVEAYKNALRLNPTDEDTRYNLAYAQQMLQEQQNQQQNQDQDQENQDENQENQDQQNQQDQNQEEQEQNQDQQQEQEQQNQDSQQSEGQQPQQRSMSKEDIQRMLEALQYEEDKLQQELQRKKARGQRIKVEKDW